MKVTLYKLDDPTAEHSWWRKEIQVNTEEDILKLVGVCAQWVYADIKYDDTDSRKLIDTVIEVTTAYRTKSAEEVIHYLFRIIKLALKLTREEK